MVTNGLNIDFNADVGDGMPTDEALIPLVSSANIACGFHAGNAATIRKTIEYCLRHQVAIGAHPSFADRQNFGRTELNLPLPEVKKLVTEQLQVMQEACNELGATLHHVKPHGALYNMSARSSELAACIAEAVRAFNPSLILFGLSGSHSVAEGVMAGLKTAAEVFADRSYQPDGSLTPRNLPGAMISDENLALEQALGLATRQEAVAANGQTIKLLAETICLHGDGPHALAFAKKIHQYFTGNGICIKSI